MNSEEIKDFIGALQGKDYIFVKFKKDTTGDNLSIITAKSEWMTWEEIMVCDDRKTKYRHYSLCHRHEIKKFTFIPPKQHEQCLQRKIPGKKRKK